MNIEAPSNHNNQPSSVEVLADFEQRRENLAPYLEELEKPGFKQSAEAKIYQKDVETFNKEWSNYGGEAIDAAQAAVDELNFKSTPEERITANSALTEARDAFYQNYLAQNETEDTPDEQPEPAVEIATAEQSATPSFNVNDAVTIGRNVYDENGAIDRSKAQNLEEGWTIESVNDDGTYHVILENGTLHDGTSGRLAKDVTAEQLEAWAEESKETEKTPDAKKAIADFMNAWNDKKYQGEAVAAPVELFPQTENVEKIPIVSEESEPQRIKVSERIADRAIRIVTNERAMNTIDRVENAVDKVRSTPDKVREARERAARVKESAQKNIEDRQKRRQRAREEARLKVLASQVDKSSAREFEEETNDDREKISRLRTPAFLRRIGQSVRDRYRMTADYAKGATKAAKETAKTVHAAGVDNARARKETQNGLSVEL